MYSKIVVVTGAAKGIGFHIAEEFGKQDYTVVLVDKDKEELEIAWTSMLKAGFYVWRRVCDVSNPTQVADLQYWILNEFGSCDILINNAGIGYQGELEYTDLATWHRLMNVNFWGVLNTTYQFLPMLENSGGQIVNVSSGQAFFQLPTWGAYTVTKAAMAVFSEILHFELAKRGVGVTTVYPFMVNTGFYDDVETEGKTIGTKLSMKLLPYYSMKPETVAKIIYKAAKKRKRVEMISPLNNVGKLSRVVPGATSVVGKLTSWLLAGNK